MNEDSSTSGSTEPQSLSWFERISQALLGEPKDREELVYLLREAQKRDLLDPDALAMIEGVLQVAEMQVRDIMIPRSQMIVIDRDMPIKEVLSVVMQSGHSRFPVIADSRDEVAGILLAKDLLRLFVEEGADNAGLMDMLRPAIYVPESKRLNVLLKEFRSSRNHIAVVVDEYGGVAGMVTIEDVLEQIVGEIEDEHDVEEGGYILKHDEDRYTVKALTPIDEFNEIFGSGFSEDEFDTIGGVLMAEIGRVPERDEEITIGDLQFKVLRSDNRRIHLLQVGAAETEPETSEEEQPLDS